MESYLSAGRVCRGLPPIVTHSQSSSRTVFIAHISFCFSAFLYYLQGHWARLSATVPRPSNTTAMTMMKPDPQVMPSSSHATPSPVNESTGHLTGFHDLSGEIRNTIYRMSLTKDKSISIVRLYDLDKPKPKPKLVTGMSFRTRRSTLPFPDKVYDREYVPPKFLAALHPGLICFSP